MRSPQEDIAIISAAGLWDRHDPLYASVLQLLLYAKGRHKPLRNLHKLADAVDRGDEAKTRKWYARLVQEVETTLRKYTDLAESAATMAAMSDEDLARLDELMRQTEGPQTTR